MILLGIVISAEIFVPDALEGFANLPETTYWASFVAPRNDIGPHMEDSNYIRNPKFFSDYTDVSRIGVPYDYCRVLAPRSNPENYFMACAIAGTDGTSSVAFRTANFNDGFRTSGDDYMRDVNADGRSDYCRIIKNKGWKAMCTRSADAGFELKDVVDVDPPEPIQSLLTFFQGCVVWLRLIDDMEDRLENVSVQKHGSITLDMTPRKLTTKGLTFNGKNQYLRISDTNDLSLGYLVPLRTIRTWMVWVKFDDFPNNAKIFDFGNGKEDNVFLGILNKGDGIIDTGSTVPDHPSGAQKVREVTPKELMETTSANVDAWECSGLEVIPRKMKHATLATNPIRLKGGKATLIYEVWDKQSRKMRMKVNACIPNGRWTHLTVTTERNDAFRPNIMIYVNGAMLLKKESGFLPSASKMSTCYLGKSNWMNNVTTYENRDELFKGSMFDFRAYNTGVSEEFIKESIVWGKGKLENFH